MLIHETGAEFDEQEIQKLYILPDHPDFVETMEHWKILAEQSGLVKERMKARLKQGLIPEQFQTWFEH